MGKNRIYLIEKKTRENEGEEKILWKYRRGCDMQKEEFDLLKTPCENDPLVNSC